MKITLAYTPEARKAVGDNIEFGGNKEAWAQWQELLVLTGYQPRVELPKKHVGSRVRVDEIEHVYKYLGKFFMENQNHSVTIKSTGE